MRRATAKKGYTARDMRAVSDNPEWTKGDFAKAKTFGEVFPGVVRKGRGPNAVKRKRSSVSS